jgi:hypothetical protein
VISELPIHDRTSAIVAHHRTIQRIAFGIASGIGRLDIISGLETIGTLALIDAIDRDIFEHNLVQVTSYAGEISLALKKCVIETMILRNQYLTAAVDHVARADRSSGPSRAALRCGCGRSATYYLRPLLRQPKGRA